MNPIQKCIVNNYPLDNSQVANASVMKRKTKTKYDFPQIIFK